MLVGGLQETRPERPVNLDSRVKDAATNGLYVFGQAQTPFETLVSFVFQMTTPRFSAARPATPRNQSMRQ